MSLLIKVIGLSCIVNLCGGLVLVLMGRKNERDGGGIGTGGERMLGMENYHFDVLEEILFA